MKEDTVDALSVDNEDNIEEEVSEATVTEIDDYRNYCMKERDDNLNRILLQNHKEVNKGCSRKKRVLCGHFSSHFGKLLAREAIHQMRRTCAVTYLRYIPR